MMNRKVTHFVVPGCLPIPELDNILCRVLVIFAGFVETVGIFITKLHSRG